MNSPVDIKAVLDAMGTDEEARRQPVRVHVYLDESAPADLGNVAIAATKTAAENATVLYDAYPPKHALPDASADLAVIVAGAEGDTAALYGGLHALGVPAVVFALDRGDVVAASRRTATPIAPADVIAPEHPERALAQSAAGEPVIEADAARSMFEAFGAWIVDVFKEKRLAFAYAFPCVRRPLALEAVKGTAVQNAGIGVVAIIPGADLPLMTLNQVKMLLEMAAAYGEELSLSRLKEILAIVGGAFACRAAARQIVSFVPGIGWAVKGGIGYAGTLAMGHALLNYFESGADVAATLQSAAGKAAQEAGVSAGRGAFGNAAAIAEAAAGKVAEAVGNASRDFVPTVASVAAAAGQATGFTQADVANLADKAMGGIRQRFGR